VKTSAAAPSYGFDADAGSCNGACGADGMLSSRVACKCDKSATSQYNITRHKEKIRHCPLPRPI